jgi:glyceraldehyde-3-phosphate dehydrogenase/erythrose-4-phosphate dehydrogenase
MKNRKVSNPIVNREMKRFVSSSGAKKVTLSALHENEVKSYVMKIENAHKKAAESKLIVR